MALISVTEAASRAGLSRVHIRRLLIAGLVKGQQIGRAWAVDEKSLDRYTANPPKPGRKPRRR